jgi:hypothetical protein
VQKGVILCENALKLTSEHLKVQKNFRLAIARHEGEGKGCQRSTCSSVATTPLTIGVLIQETKFKMLDSVRVGAVSNFSRS